MAVIVGCDIKGYSTLSLREQNVLTAHLAGCHIKSLAGVRLTPSAFNDAGDGFFVVFEPGTMWRDYMIGLSRFYFSEQHEGISGLARSHWLKIAAGEGDVYVTPQHGIRGDGINNVARVLDVCKLPIPLVIADTSADLAGLLHLKDKHGRELFVAPVQVDWTGDVCVGPTCRNKSDWPVPASIESCEGNPFYLLKHPALPRQYRDIDRYRWWDAFNAYILLTGAVRKNYQCALGCEEDWRKYISPAYVTGHTNVNIHERFSAITKLLKSTKDGSQEDPSEVRVIYLHPDSEYATRLKGENGRVLRDKILDSLKVARSYLEDEILARRVRIAFSAVPVSIGVQNRGRCMSL